jgi:hypothetical protein
MPAGEVNWVAIGAILLVAILIIAAIAWWLGDRS